MIGFHKKRRSFIPSEDKDKLALTKRLKQYQTPPASQNKPIVATRNPILSRELPVNRFSPLHSARHRPMHGARGLQNQNVIVDPRSNPKAQNRRIFGPDGYNKKY